ncbi:hypothetical protein P692DRAFT_201715993, partial [Suillus brevipes Sb2]
DWPPSTDFKTAFPELFEDFRRAVPVPNYVRRNGTLKIASHFPSNTVAPDLGKYRDDHKSISYLLSFIAGPKMYKTSLQDFTWTWPMHIMTHASATPDGKPGCAVWDLFRAQDAEELRNFLRRKFKGTYQHDPIHPQQFYLDSLEIYETRSVHGYVDFLSLRDVSRAELFPSSSSIRNRL